MKTKTFSVQRGKIEMTLFGKIIVAETNKRVLTEGLVKMSVLDYLSVVLPLGTKTIQRRLSDDNWTWRELLALQLHFKSDGIQQYIDHQFLEAKNS